MNKSTIYGPVNSWRFGSSLGIDLLFQNSICSFNCIYCQLGEIQQITSTNRTYVKTKQVIEDFEDFFSKEESAKFDVITISGNGEPTLAENIGEVIDYLKTKTDKPILILTNGTQLIDPITRKRIMNADRLIIKFDAITEEIFQKINRPASGVTLSSIIEGTMKIKEEYKGEIDLQIMIMPLNIKEITLMTKLIKQIGPKVVQLNTPKRPYPTIFDFENRGNHSGRDASSYKKLKVITKEEALEIENYLRRELPEIEFTSVYRD